MTGTRKRALMPFVAVAALLTAACAGGMAGSAGMFMWPTGTVSSYEVTTTELMNMEQPGMGEISLTTTINMSIDLESLAGDRMYRITVTDVSMSSDAAAMGGEVPNIEAISGFETTVTLNERGLIVQATNMDDAALTEVGGGESFQESLQGLFVYQPEGALGPGVTWTREYSFTNRQSGFDMNIANTDNYVCEERTTYEGTPAYKIVSTSNTTLTGGGSQEGMDLAMSASGDGEATSYIDAATGQLLYAESMGSVVGGIEVSAMGMSIPIEVRSTATVKPIK
jgi:hypothetical protein